MTLRVEIAGKQTRIDYFMRLPVDKIERTLKVLPGCADILFGGAEP